MPPTEADTEREVRVRCDCGEWLSVTANTARTECSCGATYAITVSQLLDSEGRLV